MDDKKKDENVPVGSVEAAKENRGDEKETPINDGVPGISVQLQFSFGSFFDLSLLIVPCCEASLGRLKYGKIIFTFVQNISPTTQLLSAFPQLKITLGKELEDIWRNGLNNGNDPQ